MTHDQQYRTTMPPGLRPGESPPFHKFHEDDFQDLCRDLMFYEPDVVTCSIYGIRGESQDGIDLLAHRKNGDGIEVGQCKCYEDFPPREIREASNKFFKYWKKHWSKENIRRFILFVACDLNQRMRQDEILRQKKRFRRYKIVYEAWPASAIRDKLRSRRDIVTIYFKEDYWIRAICGDVSPAFSSPGETRGQNAVVVDTVLANTLGQLAERLYGEIDQQLVQKRIAWQEGRRDEAIEWVKNIREDGTLWPALQAQVKAKILIFEASLELDTTGDLARVKQLADEAQANDSMVAQHRLRSLIAYREHGLEEAIRLLEGHEDIDSINLKAAYLLEMGKAEESISLLTFDK